EGVEARAALPRTAVVPIEPDVYLVHERRGGQRLVSALRDQPPVSDRPEVVVCQLHQGRKRVGVTLAPATQQRSDRARLVRHRRCGMARGPSANLRMCSDRARIRERITTGNGGLADGGGDSADSALRW